MLQISLSVSARIQFRLVPHIKPEIRPGPVFLVNLYQLLLRFRTEYLRQTRNAGQNTALFLICGCEERVCSVRC